MDLEGGRSRNKELISSVGRSCTWPQHLGLRVTEPSEPHEPRRVYELGEVQEAKSSRAAGRVVPGRTPDVGSHGLVNVRLLRVLGRAATEPTMRCRDPPCIAASRTRYRSHSPCFRGK